MRELKLITLDPGHFHAALVQKEMYPGVSGRAAVFAPLGPDLPAHLGRIVQFNTRRAWIIRAADLARLDELLERAASGGLLVYDIMTGRYEIPSILQPELVNDPEVFGEIATGSRKEPAVSLYY